MTVIEVNGKEETIRDEDEFALLIEEHLGEGASEYFQTLLDELTELRHDNRQLQEEVSEAYDLLEESRYRRR